MEKFIFIINILIIFLAANLFGVIGLLIVVGIMALIYSGSEHKGEK